MVGLTFAKREEIDVWIINNIIQNDARYDRDPEGRWILSFFIFNKGIVIEERRIPQIEKPSNEILTNIQKPQEIYKFIAIKLLEEKKVPREQIKIEYPFIGRRVDVYAKKGQKEILIECGPCSFQKVIEYLEQPNTEMWIITDGVGPWETKLIKFGKSQWFIFKRGPMWQKCYKKYQKFLELEWKKIEKVVRKLERF